MTVTELIEKLKQMPQDLPVYINAYCEEKEAETVHKTDAFGVGEECVEIS